METKLVGNVIPETFPANDHDRFHYTLKHVSSNIKIQAVVSFGQHLDCDILKRAVRLSLDAEPILGCRFNEDNKQPYWQRFEELDLIPWFEFVQSDNKDDKQAAIEQFLTSPFAWEGQNINVRLIRTCDVDVLGVKISHDCSDAGGLKQYLGLFSHVRKNYYV